MARYALTIFISAFLLFQVQPLIARYVLPWFGGGPAIWTSCMLFFQTMLLGGYMYAHLVSVRLTVKRQAWLHAGLLASSLVLLPIAPSESLKPGGGEAPVPAILWLLLLTVGGPYLLLSSTGPLMQRWFSRSYPKRSPYRLYALSNIGSMLALLSYPFYFEPRLRLMSQVWLWSGLYLIFALLAVWCAWRLKDLPEEGTAETELLAEPIHAGVAAGIESGVATEHPVSASRQQALAEQQAVIAATRQGPSWLHTLLWLALSASASAMLLATTNQMCIDVAVVPFLWVVPLSLYLLTFVICFDNPRWYDRRLFATLLILAVALACWQLEQSLDTTIPALVTIYSFVMFICCMVCHGELVALRPAPRFLTWFYLIVSVGGAIGGLLVAVGAPAFFLGFWEFQAALGAVCVATVAAWLANGVWQRDRPMAYWLWLIVVVAHVLGVYQFVYSPASAALSAANSFRLFLGTGVIQVAGMIAVADQQRHIRRLAIIALLTTTLQVAWVELMMHGPINWSFTILCVASSLVGWTTMVQFRRASTPIKNLLSAMLLELAALAMLCLTWESSSTDDAFWIPPEAARVAGLTTYLLLVVVGGFGNRRGKGRCSQSLWYWSSAALALTLCVMESIGYLKSAHPGLLFGSYGPFGVLDRVTVTYPLDTWVRVSMLLGIWLARCLDKLPHRIEFTRPVESADLRRGVWFIAPVGGALLMIVVSLLELVERPENAVHLSRNFYGVLKVSKLEDDIGPYLSLTHGQIEHGLQYEDEPWRSSATTYYGVGTGVEMALRLHPRRQRSVASAKPGAAPLRVAVIGLGTGSIAATSHKGDYYQFYEINPDVVELSTTGVFTYLQECAGTTEVVVGDARVMMERELKSGGSQQYDVIVVDAFSSDAIPVHLLTKECGDIYKQHLKADGILAIHISNRYLDLNPITRALADHLGWRPLRIYTDEDYVTGVYATTWVLLTANEEFASLPEVAQAHQPWEDSDLAPILWTDDFASLYQVME